MDKNVPIATSLHNANIISYCMYCWSCTSYDNLLNLTPVWEDAYLVLPLEAVETTAAEMISTSAVSWSQFWSVERRSITDRVIDIFIIRFSIIGSSSDGINIRTHIKDKLTYTLSTIYITPNLEFTLYVIR